MCSKAEIKQVEDVRTSKCGPRVKGSAKGSGFCMKCSEAAAVLVRNGDPLCRTCFLYYVVHKFRATIGKAKVVRQGEKILLAVSGGSSSSAMLDLVVRGLGKEAVKKLRFQPGVVHIDEGGILGRSADERKTTQESLKNVADMAGFPYHLAKLEDLFISENTSACSRDHLENSEISVQEAKESTPLVELFSQVDTLTAKEDLLLHLYRRQLLKVAKEHGYDRIMVGDCSTSLSIRILSDVAQGRGSQLTLNIGFEDSRSEISILRPMREFTKKEIEFYNCFNQTSSFSMPSFSTKASPHASVNRLTQEFVLGLQAAFPSTVSTILRTGDKLSSHTSSAHSESCSLCLAPLESKLDLADCLCNCSKARSCQGGCDKLVKKCSGVTQDYGGNGCCGTSDDTGWCPSSGKPCCIKEEKCYVAADAGEGLFVCEDDNKKCSQSSKQYHIHLSKTLCYGCRLTYQDLKTEKLLLPDFVCDNARKTDQRTAMKEKIKDYLIDD